MLSLPAPLRLRAADGADQPFLDALYRSTRDDLASMPVAPAMLGQLMAMQQQAQAQGLRHLHPDAAYFVLEREGAAIGRLVLDAAGERVHVLDLALLPAARGQGSASALLRALQALAAGRSQPLSLSVSLSNLGARRLYARLGFTGTGDDGVQESMRWQA